MVSAVFDTNVLASGFVGFGRLDSTPGDLLRRWTYGQFELVISAPIVTELERTLTAPYFAKRIGPALRARDLLLLEREARHTDITADVSRIATHPEDDLIIATAISARAEYLVSGDRQLQLLTRYVGTEIVSPRGFLLILIDAFDVERDR